MLAFLTLKLGVLVMRTKRAIKVITNKIMVMNQEIENQITCHFCYCSVIDGACKGENCKDEIKKFFNYLLIEGGKLHG